MSKKRQAYQITTLSLADINRVLSQIALRLDQAEGVSGNPDVHGRKIVRVGLGTKSTDALRKGQLGILVEGDNQGITGSYDDATGTLTLSIQIRTSYGLSVTANGLQLKKQAHVADASVAHAITGPADSPASADALRDDLVANTIPSIVSALNSLGATINAVLFALENAEVLASS